MHFRIWEVGFYSEENTYFSLNFFLLKRRAKKYFDKMILEHPDIRWCLGGNTVII